MLSACANKLSRLKEQAEEYAALIMEELDPERLGYIEVVLFPSLFFILYSIAIFFTIYLHFACVSVFILLIFFL